LYRVIVLFVIFCSRLKSLDPFSALKESQFTQSLSAIAALASYVLDIGADREATDDSAGEHFSSLFHVCFSETLI